MIPLRDHLAAALADRYRIERELGAGGMATVYLAHDVRHERQVAIKVLKPELAAVLGAERFVQEIKTTAALSHPHILPLFDSGEAGGFLYYVMPYIQGETIREKLNRETQFGIEEAVRITTEVADALDYAHRHGVIHRDIKPENILLHDGRAMVMDFGIALAVSAAAGGRMTETGLSLGTPHYMSPEQATADKAITARSDVYSLASVLYEMLAGEPPHTGGSAQAIIMKIIAEPVADVTTLRKSVPPNVAAAIGKALEKLPADRFASAQEFAVALANTSFTNMTASGGARRAPRPARLPTTLAAIAVLSLLAAIWGWLRPKGDSAPSPWRVTLPLPDSAPLSFGLGISADGATVVYAGPEQVGLMVRRADAVDFVPIPATRGGDQLAMSPDGRRVAFFRRGEIWVLPVAGGEAVRVAKDLTIAAPVGWSSDDGILFGDTGGIFEVPATGGSRERRTTVNTSAGEAYHLFPSPLPDGGIVFAVYGRNIDIDSSRIAVVRAGETNHAVLMPGIFAHFAAPDYLLVFQREGSIVAFPFDARAGRVTGAAVPVLQGLHPANFSTDGLFAVAASGRLVVVTKGGVAGDLSELVRVSRGGGVARIDSNWVGQFQSVAVSPDGRKIAADILTAGAEEIQVRDIRTNARARFAVPGAQLRNPSFAPAGDAIVAAGNGAATEGVYRMPLTGSTTPDRVVTASAGTQVAAPTYAPDGTTIYYHAIKGGAVSFRSRSAPASAGADSLIGSGLSVVSPDGHWVAYRSAESGVPGLYVRPMAGGASAEHWLVAPGSAGYPRWSRDGREILFRGDDSLYVVGVQAGAKFTLGTRRGLAPLAPFGASYDVFPNGDLLMLRRRSASGAKALTMIENWRAALK